MMGVYNFSPASPEEEIVFGASRPGYGRSIVSMKDFDAWLSFMQEHRVERICCLLSPEQIKDCGLELPSLYIQQLGNENVCWSPIPDGKLASLQQLKGEILPFLHQADIVKERVVVHCAAGLGRTGHVLAAWLVNGRGYRPEDALRAVQMMGRKPAEAVAWGYEAQENLLDLLQACA